MKTKIIGPFNDGKYLKIEKIGEWEAACILAKAQRLPTKGKRNKKAWI